MHNLNNIIEYIRTLSISDKKSLSEKTLKAAEELGELSREILPYSNAYATTHRFPNKTKILEESCDLMLCALSVPFSMGYSIDDITDMLKTKSDKWAGLQHASDVGKFPIPFEIHITVNTTDLERFKQACKVLDVKPIVLDLQTRRVEDSVDVMTSSVIITDNQGAYDEMKRISYGLIAAGMVVVREKIETVPWHPAAPSSKFNTTGSGGYFESHLNVIIRNEVDREYVSQVATKYGCHLSKNKFKVCDDYYNQMVTLRNTFTTREDFQQQIDIVTNALSKVDVEKVIVEYAIFDTNVSHDLNWITDSVRNK